MDKLRAAGMAVMAVTSDKSETVRVVVRCRPLNKKELEDGREQIVHMDPTNGTCTVTPPGANEPPKNFTFDAVYAPNTRQEVLYKQSASSIVDSVLQGYNGTIFAYGQTGTGKTFTMEGVNHDEELKGIIPRAFMQIFAGIETSGGANREFLVRASYLEIYNEEIRDLLSKNSANKLELKENPDAGVYVRDLTSYVVKSTRECDKLRDFGAKNRHVGATAMNQDSSRSHSIYTITVESCETREDGSPSIRMGKLNLVDLAGSERQSKTQASGDRLKEATKINLSLSALGNCISALVDGKSAHIPYRDSKLTRLLQDSLGGNTKTVMVANLGPADWNYDETISTLRYANRAKNIKNKPKINEDPKDAMLREFQEEIQRLKDQLAAAGGSGGGGGGGGGSSSGFGGGGVREVHKDVVRERIIEVERPVEVERIVEVEKQVIVDRQVEKIVEIEKLREVEKIVEVYHDVEVEREVIVEKLVGLRDEDVEEMRLQMGREAERERERLLREHEARDAEVNRHRSALEQEQLRLEKEAEEAQRLQAQLEALEAKIMHGGEHVRDRVSRQERELAEREKELEAQREKEVQIKQAMERREEERLAKEEQYSSLREEVEGKSKKLKKMLQKYKAAKAELEDIRAEQAQEKEDLLQTVRELTRQVQLQNMVIDAFVPNEEVKKLEMRAVWDDSGTEQWRLKPLSEARDDAASQRPKSHPTLLRPTSFLSRKMAADLTNNDPRYRALNVLSFDLDMPERTTADYEGDINPNVRQALTAALKDDEQLEVDAEENLPTMPPMAPGFGTGWVPGTAPGMPPPPASGRGAARATGAAAAGTKPKARGKKTASRRNTEDDELDALLNGGKPSGPSAEEEQFPSSRGLINRRAMR
jgi:kinesin family protein 3/17